jgi:hypothetical protein
MYYEVILYNAEELIELNFIFLDQVSWLYSNMIKSVKGGEAHSSKNHSKLYSSISL